MNCRVSFKSRDYKMKQCFNLIYLSQVKVNFSSPLLFSLDSARMHVITLVLACLG